MVSGEAGILPSLWGSGDLFRRPRTALFSPRPLPWLLRLLTSLTVLPSEVFWTDAVRAVWHAHTGPSLLAGAVFAAVV